MEQKFFTLKEIMHEIERANQISEITKNKKNYLVLQDDYNLFEHFDTYKKAKKYICENFIDEIKETFLNKITFDSAKNYEVKISTKYCTYKLYLICY